MSILKTLAIAGLLGFGAPAVAWEHVDSKVDFVEYREGIIEDLRAKDRPFFLLFSAEWCHWCHEFGRVTLSNDEVARYLNANFTNVFIDADIHSAAYLKYRATGLPYTVFLNPDTSPHFRYSGTLYSEDFLTVIKQIKANVAEGLSVEENRAKEYAYQPPEKLALADVKAAGHEFRRGLVDSFDPEEHGLGKGEKAIYPRTFLYLLSGGDDKLRQDSLTFIQKTLHRAVERIYDSVEGGFFRYAETRDWKVPHYEKMADLNAGVTLLLYRINQITPSPVLVSAAERTLSYLRGTLYDPKLGVFLSFQEADTHYYAIKTREDRRKAQTPAIIEKIFIDRLALTVSYLLDVLDFRPDKALKQQLASSLDFIADEIENDGVLQRYYTVSSAKWSGSGTLQDYALVGQMFLKAHSRLQAPRYRILARKVVDKAIELYRNPRIGVLTDPSLGGTDDAEFLMEVNSLIAQTLLGLNDDGNYRALVDETVRYFSAMGEIFEERLWDGVDWEFTERYVPYLRLVDSYLNPSGLAGIVK